MLELLERRWKIHFFSQIPEIAKTRYPLRDNGFLWSCWADLNWGPHPYQLTKGCCCLLLFILPYRIQSIVPQYFQQLPPAPYRSLSRLKIDCFLMPVSVLCRFLAEPAPADLIPTPAVLRPIRAAFLRPVRPIRELQRPDRGARVQTPAQGQRRAPGVSCGQREGRGAHTAPLSVYSGNTRDRSMIQSSRTLTRSLSPAAPKSFALYRPSSSTNACTDLSAGSTIQYSRTPARW